MSGQETTNKQALDDMKMEIALLKLLYENKTINKDTYNATMKAYHSHANKSKEAA